MIGNRTRYQQQIGVPRGWRYEETKAMNVVEGFVYLLKLAHAGAAGTAVYKEDMKRATEDFSQLGGNIIVCYHGSGPFVSRIPIDSALNAPHAAKAMYTATIVHKDLLSLMAECTGWAARNHRNSSIPRSFSPAGQPR
jgi:hypothetical protein